MSASLRSRTIQNDADEIQAADRAKLFQRHICGAPVGLCGRDLEHRADDDKVEILAPHLQKPIEGSALDQCEYRPSEAFFDVFLGAEGHREIRVHTLRPSLG
jgi:hypothetical protein